MLKFFDPSREDQEKVASLARQVAAARNAFMKAQDALAFVVLALAEADCKGASEAYEKLQQVRLAHQGISRHLEALLIELQGRHAPTLYETGIGGAESEAQNVDTGKAPPAPVKSPLPTPRQINETAAHLIATLDSMPVEFENLPGPVKDVFHKLREECEAAGLMAPYVFPGTTGFRVSRKTSGDGEPGTG